MTKLHSQKGYKNLIQDIGIILDEGRKQAYKTVNNILVKTYWEVGEKIVEFEQKGSEKAEYGTDLLDKLAADLKSQFGKGFSRRNVLDMRRFYVAYPKWQTVSAELSWSHYVQILGVDDDLARMFYEKQCIKEKWSIRELKRQKDSMLFERIALSKDKKGVLELSKEGQNIKQAKDIIKEPYVLEFLGIPENHKYSEAELEQKIIDNLQMFLLELGKGFTFVKRQFRISFREKHFYVDLVFYHRILKCFVLIDLKINEVNHTDVGQMNLYLNYFAKEENEKDDNPPIGIVLGKDKDELKIEYALGGISNKLFVSKYQLYLPKEEELEAEVEKLIDESSRKINGFQDTIDWYNSNATEYSSNIENIPSLNLLDKFTTFIKHKGKVLDAGCAAGRDCILLKERGLDPTGVDLSESLLEIAKEKYPDIKFAHANFLNLPFENDSFDGVWAHASLLHLETAKAVNKALKEFHRILKRGGIIHIFVKQQQGEKKTEIISDKLSGHDRFFQWFTKNEIISLLKKTGFELKEIQDEVKDLAGRDEVKWIIAFAEKK